MLKHEIMKKRRSRRRKADKQNIYVADWLSYKPYKKPTAYDEFYTKIANKIYDILEAYRNSFYYKVEKQDVLVMSIGIAQYVEDYASDIGLWKAFITMNEDLYGYALPFYDLSDYYKDDLNQADIQFLLWYYFGSIHETTYLPYMSKFEEASQKIFALLEQYEELPAISAYEKFYEVKSTDSYFDLKTKIAYLTNKSFLFGLPAGEYFRNQMEEVEEELIRHIDPEMIAYYIQERMMFSHRYSLNAVTVLEYFAKVARCDEATRQKILNLTKRATGDFVYRKSGKKYHEFEHWMTGVKFDVLKDSMQNLINQSKNGDVSIMELVFWNGDWWLSGMSLGGRRETDEKPSWSEAEYSFYSNNEATQKRLLEQTALTHQVFMETFNNFIYYAVDEEDFLSAYALVQQKTLRANQAFMGKKLSNEGIDENIEGLMRSMRANSKDYEDGVAIISLENMGLTFVVSYGEAVEYLEKDSLTKEERGDLYDMLIVNYEPEVTEYLLQNYPSKNLVLPVLNEDQLDVPKYWKFLHRYSNAEVYDERLPMMKATDQLEEEEN